MVSPYINMNPPQVYTCSLSWTLLPLPSPYHPSGSSQGTSPKHPVSCIKPFHSWYWCFEFSLFASWSVSLGIYKFLHFFFKKPNLFIYFCLALLGLPCCTDFFFSSCCDQGLLSSCGTWASHCSSFSRAHELEGIQVSVAAICGLNSCGSQALEHGLSSCGTRAWLPHNMWDLPWPGIEPICLLHWPADFSPLSHQLLLFSC